MRKYFNDGTVEFELELNEVSSDDDAGACGYCSYIDTCQNFYYPFTAEDGDMFDDFCINVIGAGYYPKEGTIEENIPYVIPGIKERKENIEIKNTINTFCNKVCIMECTEGCPMSKYKKKED